MTQWLVEEAVGIVSRRREAEAVEEAVEQSAAAERLTAMALRQGQRG